jgi:hypothetical protein
VSPATRVRWPVLHTISAILLPKYFCLSGADKLESGKGDVQDRISFAEFEAPRPTLRFEGCSEGPTGASPHEMTYRIFRRIE